VHRVVSPFARRPVVTGDRVVCIGAARDEIAPMAHARQLAAHFDARLETLPGGHVLQVGRGLAFARLRPLLERCLCEPDEETLR
jgi:pimeloyl-ACP methyl ester carboxylesterase